MADKAQAMEAAIHPNSRKAQRMERNEFRKSKVAARKATKEREKDRPLVQKLRWFQEHLPPDKLRYSTADIHALIKEYLSRNDTELQRLEQLNKKTTGQDLLEAAIKHERALYRSGFAAPDLTNLRNLKRLRDWDGGVNGASNIAMREFRDPDHLSSL
eukprot:EC121156.1.p1 GENE.EC121156.1~~EC121156.1.p1  ORF type:complete len:158 (+),score=20.83 EC121156.1:81-554(+)